jgi:methyl-accepting chemotaxis protein
MPEDVFRIVITVAVILACLAFLVQALVAIGIFRVARALQKKVSPLVDHVETISTKVVPVVEKLGPTIDKTGPAIEAATRVIAAVQKTVDETRPRVAEISAEAAAIAKSTRRQVERIGGLLGDAGEKARERLEQIDRSVDNTVEHLEQAGETMKRAVMRPVREVNGLAAGIGAAMSTLVHGSHRPSVDHATQDEEMFI